MKKKLTGQTILIRNGSIPATTIDGEVALMNINTGKYLSMNKIGSDIWKILDKPTSLDELIAALMSEYDIDRDKCHAQVKEFVERLIHEGLVMISRR